MTDRIDALDSLIEKIEADKPRTREDWRSAGFNEPHIARIGEQSSEGSLDAAMVLFAFFLPNHDVDFSIVISNRNQTYVTIWRPCGEKVAETCNESPARAWLLAILKALRAEYHEKQANGGEW